MDIPDLRGCHQSVANPLGDPPALPGWQQTFDIFGNVLHRRSSKKCSFELQNVEQGISNFEVQVRSNSAVRNSLFDILNFFWLRSGSFEEPATLKPPALPEDTYSAAG